MKRRLLIIGGSGMLASDLAREAESRGFDVRPLSHQELDVTSPEMVSAVLDAIRPQYIAYTAGIGVDYCEEHPEEAYQVHAWGVSCVARHAERIGAVLAYVSSCGLFGDDRRFYNEYDPVVLKNRYAHSKYAGELSAMRTCGRLYVIRPGWLFGGDPTHKRNFVFQRFKEAQEKSVLESASDKFGCPTYTVDLAREILDLFETDQFGTYHVTNADGCSRFEYVRSIIDAFGLRTAVQPVDSSHFPRAAPTPDSEMLANLNLRFLGREQLPPWQDAIQRYVQSLRLSLRL